VSNKWRDLLRRPAAWKQVEISMPRKFGGDYRKENLFFDHLLKYCTAVTDLHLTLGSPVAQLDEILQIKTLERLVLNGNLVPCQKKYWCESLHAEDCGC
jgi:hypothetical protein